MFFANGWKWYGRPSEPAGWRAGWHDLFRQFDRGLLCELRLPGRLAHLAADLSGLFAAEPVGAIAFEGAGVRASHLQAVRRLAVPPRPVRLVFRSVLHTGDPVGYFNAAVNSMLASAAVALDATGHPRALDAITAVVRSPFLSDLRELVLDFTRPQGAGAALLASSPRFAGLKRLSLRNADVWADWLVVLRDRFGERLVV